MCDDRAAKAAVLYIAAMRDARLRDCETGKNQSSETV